MTDRDLYLIKEMVTLFSRAIVEAATKLADALKYCVDAGKQEIRKPGEEDQAQ